MRTQKQIEASRRNGAKSRGPVTAAGKRISAANSPRRSSVRPFETQRSLSCQEELQILANTVALPAERSEEFLQLLHNYRLSLQPIGFIEERVVETITACDWYRRRYWGLGMAKVAHATAIQEQ